MAREREDKLARSRKEEERGSKNGEWLANEDKQRRTSRWRKTNDVNGGR